MPETRLQFGAALVCGESPLAEHDLVEEYDMEKVTHKFKCRVKTANQKFSVVVNSRDLHQTRMGVLVFINNKEKNCLNLSPGRSVSFNGLEFGGMGVVRVELWRCAGPQATPQVDYLDTYPRVVFEYTFGPQFVDYDKSVYDTLKERDGAKALVSLIAEMHGSTILNEVLALHVDRIEFSDDE